MKYRFEKEFRTAHPETLGETDSDFDLDNYKDWLEDEYCKLLLIDKVKEVDEIICECGEKQKTLCLK
jgi:hypothetical protein